jgi:Family of unknown function (DUF5675)
MILTATRDHQDANCTLSTLPVGSVNFDILELPWRPNPPALCGRLSDSCVPVGTYQLVLHNTMAHPHTWALVNPAIGIYHEPGDITDGEVARYAVLLHEGNFPKDSLGCLLIGRSRELVNGAWMVTDSRNALAAFKAAVPWQEHTLIVRSSI